jgi:hypothetical protein
MQPDRIEPDAGLLAEPQGLSQKDQHQSYVAVARQRITKRNLTTDKSRPQCFSLRQLCIEVAELELRPHKDDTIHKQFKLHELP